MQKNSPRGVHFRRAGPREQVYFRSEEVCACIVTCGGLCPGINTVIREIICGLNNMYGVSNIIGIEGGYRGFYSKNTIPLTPKAVNDIHKRGGTILRTSRGGHVTSKIVDSIQYRKINQVYIIGGDGTQKGAAAIYQRVTEATNVIKVTARMWARLLASTNQPSFFRSDEEVQEIVDRETLDLIDNMRINSL